MHILKQTVSHNKKLMQPKALKEVPTYGDVNALIFGAADVKKNSKTDLMSDMSCNCCYHHHIASCCCHCLAALQMV